MAGETTIAILPCADLDETLAFYAALGFATTYRQLRPNPYAAVRRGDIELHFAGIDGFEPERSYGSVIVVVPDAEGLRTDFADGLRASYGRVPTTGIPRLLRLRKKAGTVAGFSVVDPGGNWLRVYPAGGREGEDDDVTGLAKVVLGAARQGDAKGSDAAAARMLDAGLLRHPDAPVEDRVEALVYRAELALRLGDPACARRLLAEVAATDLTATQRAAVSTHLTAADEIAADLS